MSIVLFHLTCISGGESVGREGWRGGRGGGGGGGRRGGGGGARPYEVAYIGVVVATCHGHNSSVFYTVAREFKIPVCLLSTLGRTNFLCSPLLFSLVRFVK